MGQTGRSTPHCWCGQGIHRVLQCCLAANLQEQWALGGSMHTGITAPNRINFVFAELHPGAASLFQILRVPETSFIQNLTQN